MRDTLKSSYDAHLVLQADKILAEKVEENETKRLEKALTDKE